ncbi:hypothetical protein GGR54DRAFT_609234 [Hypoxylon sp. NC1633]|nr:hypothetical protein GGR54DRAFT_609234 [Hypoxylon sp. NC1633]
MASLASFHPFARLPKEIQMQIWRAFIIEAHEDRLVVLCQQTRMIMPTPFLASPAFMIGSTCRATFLTLYPDHIPVFRTYMPPTFQDSDDSDCSDGFESDPGSEYNLTPEGERCGTIHASFDRDIFVIRGIFRRNYDFRGELTLKCATRYIQYPDLARMKNLMEVIQKGRPWDPHKTIRHMVKKNRHGFSKWTFCAAETCRHLYWFSEHEDLDDWHNEQQDGPGNDILLCPAREVFKKYESEIVFYDRNMLEPAYD